MEAGEIVGWLLGGGGAGKMVWDLIRARGESRRTDAAAAKTLVATANASAAEWQKDLTEIRTEVRDLRAEQRRQEDRITAHVRWDRQVVETLRDLGGTISDPPPLYPEEAP